MELSSLLVNSIHGFELIGDMKRVTNPKVLKSLMGPALRGLVLQRAKNEDATKIKMHGESVFNWRYTSEGNHYTKLYEKAKDGQWDGRRDLEWGTQVDPYNDDFNLISDESLPLREIPAYRKLPKRIQQEHRKEMLAWLLSQFLHGEQGALMAACQITESIEFLDGKLYSSTQVMDEARHVEVFHRYLTTKLERLYDINDNLYVVIDALMHDSRWDMKFLGMQIMIEGLALGAFSTMRHSTKEPLLREMLKYVITDEARHVHFGVTSLQHFYLNELPDQEVKERQDWAYEMCLLLRNRFLAHEFYDEFYGHLLSRKDWNSLILESGFMETFRNSLFRRLIPNLKRIGLLPERMRRHYEALGLMRYEFEKAATELTGSDLLHAK